MKLIDLTNDEIKQILQDIFQPKKITCIKRNKKYDEIYCKMYTEWKSINDNGEEEINLIADDITLRNPFNNDKYDSFGITDFEITYNDYKKLKQFCYAKGIYGHSIDFLFDNPYLKKKGE